MEKSSTGVEKIAPKNNSFYQEFIALYGTFAIPEKQGLIIDKSWLLNLDRHPLKRPGRR